MKICIGGCFFGDPLEFSNWRLLLARAAGYGVSSWEFDGYTHLIPDLDYDLITAQNTLGIWDEVPDDVLLVLLAHADEDGMIYPQYADLLANRLEELLPDLHKASMHGKDSVAHDAEIDMTNEFINGLRDAHAWDSSVIFSLVEDD